MLYIAPVTLSPLSLSVCLSVYIHVHVHCTCVYYVLVQHVYKQPSYSISCLIHALCKRSTLLLSANSNYVTRANTCILLRIHMHCTTVHVKIVPHSGHFCTVQNIVRNVLHFPQHVAHLYYGLVHVREHTYRFVHCHSCTCCQQRVGVKPGLWTLDWTVGLDRWTDSRFCACVGRSN